MKQRWFIAVGNWGVIDEVMTAEEAEEKRRNKANWERSPAMKVTAKEFSMLTPEQINKHWWFRMIEQHLEAK